MNTGSRLESVGVVSGRAGFASPAVPVVAGVITDVRGRVLLARRTAGRDLAGAWEFPGGKVELGESPFQALDRELHEELGIRVHSIEPLIRVAQSYAVKRIVLDVYRVLRFRGKPRGLEQQALAWSPCDKLATYPMPPADRPVVAALTEPASYLITPDCIGDPNQFLHALDRALQAGIRRVQLRVNSLEGDALTRLASAARRLCDAVGAELLINADLALAEKLNCGVHLPAAQLMALSARPLPAGMRVAASCHDEAELRRAQAIGADFVVLGPVRETPSHPGKRVMGWDGFVALREHVSLPIYALGGMDVAQMEIARRLGAQGGAGIRGFWEGS